MRPMLGLWRVDLDATMSENASLPEAVREFIRRDLTTHPFDLTITDRQYVSVSRARTNVDLYSVVELNRPAATIAPTSADGVQRHADRRTTLRIRDGKLLIGTGTGLTCVMNRPATGGGEQPAAAHINPAAAWGSHKTQKPLPKQGFALKSGRQDLNLRPLDPQSSALNQAELRPVGRVH